MKAIDDRIARYYREKFLFSPLLTVSIRILPFLAAIIRDGVYNAVHDPDIHSARRGG